MVAHAFRDRLKLPKDYELSVLLRECTVNSYEINFILVVL